MTEKDTQKQCLYCQAHYISCYFDRKATGIANDHIFDPTIKHQLIADARIEAKAMNCPNADTVNPDYPGKEKL